jgi:hypothetical protein
MWQSQAGLMLSTPDGVRQRTIPYTPARVKAAIAAQA